MTTPTTNPAPEPSDELREQVAQLWSKLLSTEDAIGDIVRFVARHVATQHAALLAEIDRREAASRGHIVEITALLTERDELRLMGEKVNAIRNSIVGMQGFNFSEHAYPLVAALDAAGFKGLNYAEAKANLGTMIEQRDKAEAERDELLGRLAAFKDQFTSDTSSLNATRAQLAATEALVGKMREDFQVYHCSVMAYGDANQVERVTAYNAALRLTVSDFLPKPAAERTHGDTGPGGAQPADNPFTQ